MTQSLPLTISFDLMTVVRFLVFLFVGTFVEIVAIIFWMDYITKFDVYFFLGIVSLFVPIIGLVEITSYYENKEKRRLRKA